MELEIILHHCLSRPELVMDQHLMISTHVSVDFSTGEISLTSSVNYPPGWEYKVYTQHYQHFSLRKMCSVCSTINLYFFPPHICSGRVVIRLQKCLQFGWWLILQSRLDRGNRCKYCYPMYWPRRYSPTSILPPPSPGISWLDIRHRERERLH